MLPKAPGEECRFLAGETEFLTPLWAPKFVEDLRARIRKAPGRIMRTNFYNYLDLVAGDTSEYKLNEAEIKKEAVGE